MPKGHGVLRTDEKMAGIRVSSFAASRDDIKGEFLCHHVISTRRSIQPGHFDKTNSLSLKEQEGNQGRFKKSIGAPERLSFSSRA